MPDITKAICSESRDFEHKYLREELAANKRLIFERALVIVAAGLAASLLSKDAQGVQLVGIPTIGALAFSLWLTTNRVKSNSRIVAYIQLFHEADCSISWIGWENSLRLHRLWLKQFPDRLNEVRLEYAKILQYDNLSFYRPIFILHLSMAVLAAVLMSFTSWTAAPFHTPMGDLPDYIIPLINLTLTAVFCLWAYRYRPATFQQGIERQRLIWCAVFDAKTKGELAT